MTGRTAFAALRAEPRAAIGLLTRLPVTTPDRSGGDLDALDAPAARTGAAAFGMVGAGLGLVAAAPVLLLGAALPFLAAVLAILVIAVASGALHLDGLADTADALAAPDPAAAERARRDPRVGAAGAVAVVGALLVDVAALAGTSDLAGPVTAALGLVVAASGSRAAAVVLARLGTGAGPTAPESTAPAESAAPAEAAAPADGGFGAWFAARVGRWDVVAALGSAAVAALALARFGSVSAAVAAVAGALAGLGLSVGVVRIRGSLDGDGLGAGVELVFAATLVAIAVWSAVAAGSAAVP
ncbi:MAG TPA: adenosylcobinamide-GDP ribazoletransferase [Candidatus Limnocylindrales bacterium]|nr:adenosylcobinamide-GDP ribazoletransferase [Candidatus Limnocylindrales bacterium]